MSQQPKASKNKNEAAVSSSWFLSDMVHFFRELPVTSIMRYIYKHDPLILFAVVTSNWVIPPTIELIAPWWLVPHSILAEYTQMQHDLNQQLNAMDLTSLSLRAIHKLVGLTLYYSSLRTVSKYVNGRVNLRLRMLMRRLIMEKIVYSEIDSLQNAYSATLGYAIDARQLERRILSDVNSSVTVMFDQLPNLITHSTRLGRNVYRLYHQRDRLDAVLVAYPFLYQFTREVLGALTTWDMSDALNRKQRHYNMLMSKLIQNTVVGLNEIQIMNYGPHQLLKLDSLMDRYFESRYSRSALYMDLMDDIRNHSILRWLLETLLEIRIRTQRYADPSMTPLTHKEYGRLKAQCNTLYNSLTKLYLSINAMRYSVHRQLYLKKVLDLPGYADEEELLKRHRGYETTVEFECVEFKYVYFKYEKTYATGTDKTKTAASADEERKQEEVVDATVDAQCIDEQVELIKRKRNQQQLQQQHVQQPTTEQKEETDVDATEETKTAELISDDKKNEAPNATASAWSQYEFKLLINESIRFERGTTYGMCGRNESGKSTLIDVLCKLRKPQYSEVVMNDSISFSLIPRVELREQISYISQKPLLFEGSVGENIHIANPSATNEEVLQAAKLAGVFLSVENDSNESLAYNEISRIMMEQEHSKNNSRGSFRGRGRGSNKKRGGRGKRRKGGGGRNNIARHMVEGIVKWGKTEKGAAEKEDYADDMEGAKDSESTTTWLSDYVKSFFTRLDRRQVQEQGDKDVDAEAESMADLDANGKHRKRKSWRKKDYEHQILNFEIRNNGSNVSGGMKQSIALSRVFLRKQARIVICDESFNSMDMVKKNQYIYPALFEFAKQCNMTLIIISHDILECFQKLDHVILMDRGCVFQQGTHQHLYDNCDLYQRLCGNTK